MNTPTQVPTEDPISEAFARRLRDVERAGRLRNLLCSAETGAWESWRLCEFRYRRPAQAAAHLRAANFYHHLSLKVRSLQARARGEA